jgi:LysR family transcriptional regulator of abg operon
VLVQGLVPEPLFRNTRTVGGRKGHPSAGARSIKDPAAAEWATTSIDYNAADDLTALFAEYRMREPKLLLQTRSALSVIVGLAYSDLLALLPVQRNEFPLTRGVLQVVDIEGRLPAPSIVCIRRPDLALTPPADYFCDLLRRRAPVVE